MTLADMQGVLWCVGNELGRGQRRAGGHSSPFLSSDMEAEACGRVRACGAGLCTQAVCPLPACSGRLRLVELGPSEGSFQAPTPGSRKRGLIWKQRLCRWSPVRELELRSSWVQGGLCTQRLVSL